MRAGAYRIAHTAVPDYCVPDASYKVLGTNFLGFVSRPFGFHPFGDGANASTNAPAWSPASGGSRFAAARPLGRFDPVEAVHRPSIAQPGRAHKSARTALR